MPILSSEQLTGRVRSHVTEQADLRCALHPAVAQAFRGLAAAAADAGIDLAVVSAFRDFSQQLAIWNGKFHGQRPLLDRDGRVLDAQALSAAERVEAILVWSALPGASRHHWGTDLDVIDRTALPPPGRPQLVPAEYASGGVFEHLGRWLPHHCARFGFFLPYDVDRGGVQVEPWHLSYAPIAAGALAGLTVEVWREALGAADLAGADCVLPQLPALHRRYVQAVARPGAAVAL